MKLEDKIRAAHADRVMNATKKIDNNAPRLFPRIPRTERAAFRLDDLMLENKQLLERICTIWRTKGLVDNSCPNVEWKSNFRERMWEMVRREADNVALLYFIQQAVPLVPTRNECARDFRKAVEMMRFKCKYPLHFLKDYRKERPLPMPDPPAINPEEPPRKRVFMDFITSQERFLGRIELELFEAQAPQTVANFLAHVRGEAPRPPDDDDHDDGHGAGDEEPRTYSYCDSPLHRILPGYYVLGGDVVNRNGSAGSSIHGGVPFADEKNELTHCEPGLLCTIGARPDSNDSKFMLTMKALPTLDGTSTVFGRVVKGFDVLRAINALGAKASGKPVVQVFCCNCGDVQRPAAGRKRKTLGLKRKQLDGLGESQSRPRAEADVTGRVRRRRRCSLQQQYRGGRSYSSIRLSSLSSGVGNWHHRSPYAPSRTFRA